MNRLDSTLRYGVYFANRRLDLREEEKLASILNEDELRPSDPTGFSREELVACQACKRANPPTRSNCLYCGAGLPVTESSLGAVKLSLRPLEDWEQGFNVILVGNNKEHPDNELSKLSDLIQLDKENLQRILSSESALPLARCAVSSDAAVVEKRLSEMGFKVLIVSDSELDAYQPIRVRSLAFTGDSLVLQPIGVATPETISWQDISLIVTGRRLVRRLEVAERTAKRNTKEVVSSRELNSDAERLDIYSNRDGAGWRISEDNFDFSCLGDRKTLLASKNFQTLKEVLRERAHAANYDDSYMRERQPLSLIWPLAQQTESLGLRKPRSGRINTAAVTTSDNDRQFTRYSRLLNYLKLRNSELSA